MPLWLLQVANLYPIDPYASVGGLIEAFEEVLDLGCHLLIPHGLGRFAHVHHHGPLEVRHDAGCSVDAVIVRQGGPIAGDVARASAIGVGLYGKLKHVRRVERQSPAPIQGTAPLKIAMIAWYFAGEPEVGCSAT
jgi:hypothetical protein